MLSHRGCDGSLKVIACIEDRQITTRSLAHLREKEQEGSVSVNHAVYGRIPALQNVHSGSYSDVVNVLLTF